jgi:anti-sigma factor RsiW
VPFRFLRRRRARDIVCREAVELVSDYLDGTLADPERVRLEAHLAGCPHCTEYLEQIRTIVAAAGQVEPGDLSEEAVADLVALYRRWRAD